MRKSEEHRGISGLCRRNLADGHRHHPCQHRIGWFGLRLVSLTDSARYQRAESASDCLFGSNEGSGDAVAIHFAGMRRRSPTAGCGRRTDHHHRKREVRGCPTTTSISTSAVHPPARKGPAPVGRCIPNSCTSPARAVILDRSENAPGRVRGRTRSVRSPRTAGVNAEECYSVARGSGRVEPVGKGWAGAAGRAARH